MTEAGSTWAPLRSPIYRALWIAQLVSNLGTWMQTVGAQWMLVGDPRAAVLVPLVQTATTLPVMLLALPSGVLADLVDRRRLLIATQAAMAAGVGVLASLTGSGLATPAVLLTLLFLIGCGQALTGPAWQAILKERNWLDLYQPADEFAAFLEEDQAKIASTLQAIGLVQ